MSLDFTDSSRGQRGPSSHVLTRIATALGLACASAPGAWAAPNPLCPGTCAGTSSACGEAADCGEGGSCVFADACLPGLAALVTKVAPDRPGGPNDPSEGWVCGLGRCDRNLSELTFSTQYGIEAAATKTFRVSVGARVLVRFELRAARGAWGYAAIAMADGHEVRSASLIGDSDDTWQTVELFVNLAGVPSGELTLALHAVGGGLTLRNVSVLTLRDYDVYVRFALLAPEVPAHFKDRTVLRHADSGPLPDFCQGDEVPADDGCIDPAIIEGDASAGLPSAWLPIGSIFAGGRRATHGWEVDDPLSGAPMIGPLTVRTEVAWAPSESAIVWSDERTIGSAGHPAIVGVVLPEGPPAPAALRADIGTPAALLAADTAFLPKRQQRPSGFSVTAVVEPGDAFGDADDAVRAALPILARLGLSVAGFLSLDPSPEAETVAHEQGLRATWVDARSLIEGLEADGPLDFDASLDTAPAVAARLDALLGSDSAPTTAIGRALARAKAAGGGIVTLGNGALRAFRVAGPAYRAGLRTWLQAQGVTPAELGRANWDAVVPFESATLADVRAARPDPSDAAAARRYVWTIRYWTRAQTILIATLEVAFHAHGLAFAPLLGSPLAADASAGAFLAPSGVDAASLGESGALGGVMVDATLSGQGDCHPWELGLVADWAAGFADPLRDRYADRGELPVGALVDVTRGGPTQRIFELAARGFTWFGDRSYGPYDFAPSAAAGGLGATSREWFAAVAQANARLADAEVVLAGAHRMPSSTVFIASTSEALWRDGAAIDTNLVGWHAALSQAHWNVDVLPDTEVAASALTHPGRPRHLAFVLASHLSEAAWSAVKSWVEAGGTLVVGPELPIDDEFGQRVTAREEWLGAALSDGSEAHATTIDWMSSGSLIGFSYSGPLRTIQTLEGGTIGETADGSVVAVRLHRERGNVVILGMDLGRAFLASVTCDTQLPPSLAKYASGYAPELGRVMATLPVSAGLSRAVAVDRSDVAAQVVTSVGGSALLLVSYANGPVDVAVTAHGLLDCPSVTDLVSGDSYPVAYGSFHLKLGDVALLTWDESECEGLAPIDVAPDSQPDVAAEPAERVDRGCQSGDAASAASLLGALALLTLLRARRRPSSA